MQKYVERMIQEKIDLEGKIKNAKRIIACEPFDMDKKQKLMLAEQVKVMDQYLAILCERLDYEKHKED